MNNLMQIVFISIPILIVVMMLTGCSQLEDMQREQQQQLTCEPIEAVGCIGWLGSKPIMLEQEL
tara:strand:- start:101 stop:292 length:192 start_codon:yes stop_codon:yes gene_type:complete